MAGKYEERLEKVIESMTKALYLNRTNGDRKELERLMLFMYNEYLDVVIDKMEGETKEIDVPSFMINK